VDALTDLVISWLGMGRRFPPRTRGAERTRLPTVRPFVSRPGLMKPIFRDAVVVVVREERVVWTVWDVTFLCNLNPPPGSV
jgi:hypothetical protein